LLTNSYFFPSNTMKRPSAFRKTIQPLTKHVGTTRIDSDKGRVDGLRPVHNEVVAAARIITLPWPPNDIASFLVSSVGKLTDNFERLIPVIVSLNWSGPAAFP